MPSSSSLLLLPLLAPLISAHPQGTVDTSFPYTGPAVPVGDWVDPSVNGNGKGFPRLVEPPAVKPAKKDPSNNVNVISLAYVPGGINIHYQTPFGLGEAPSVKWGEKKEMLGSVQSGFSHSYDRTPPCSEIAAVTQCSQYFHEVQITGLKPGTTYYYQIPAANGTTASDVLSFTTAREAGSEGEFTIAVLNDMGYTNAYGTFTEISKAVDEGLAFAWHGGDLSYADDWYSGILPCEDDWPVCYNGTSTELPGNFPIPPEYLVPLPEGEVANQGGPQGGDMSVIYESNWDLWQQWLNGITSKVPYMVLPGNHEASCGEFDGPGNVLTTYLNDDEANTTTAKSALTYYSCPPSQRNFTAYSHRFHMPGKETGGVGNMWYSFDYGLAHFISFDGETDFANSPEWPFIRDTKGKSTTPTTESETFITDAGPFGALTNYTDTKSYAQYQWLQKDLAAIDRTKTPWVIAMTHRPMYSSQVSSYQANIRAAFEDLLLEYGVDVYLSGHIHWYERLWPLTATGEIDSASIVDNNTYYTNPGVSLTHVINGMAGNIESHSTLDAGEEPLNITAVLDFQHYGFSKLKIINSTAMSMSFIKGADGSVGDEVTLLKKAGSTGPTGTSTGTSAPTSTSTATGTSAATGTTTGTAAPTSTLASNGTAPATYPASSMVTTAITTYCSEPTTITEGYTTYTVTAPTTLVMTVTYAATSPASYPTGPSYPTSGVAPVGTGGVAPVGTGGVAPVGTGSSTGPSPPSVPTTGASSSPSPVTGGAASVAGAGVAAAVGVLGAALALL